MKIPDPLKPAFHNCITPDGAERDSDTSDNYSDISVSNETQHDSSHDESTANQTVFDYKNSESDRLSEEKSCSSSTNSKCSSFETSFVAEVIESAKAGKSGTRRVFQLPAQFLKDYWSVDRSRLKTGWTGPFFRKFSNTYALCPLRAHSNTICYGTRKKKYHRLNINSSCKMEGCAEYRFFIDEDVDVNKDITVQCVQLGDYCHKAGDTNRRPIREPERSEIAKQIESTAPSIQELKYLKELPEDELRAGNYTKAPSAMLLRKIQSDYRARFDLSTDQWEFLRKLKREYDEREDLKSNKITGFIQEIGDTPFFVILFSINQIKLVPQLAKIGPVFLHLDATGTIVESPSADSKLPYYYALIVAGSETHSAIPIGEFISCSHDVRHIYFFLKAIDVALKAIHPTSTPLIAKIEIDGSKALLQASLQAFNNSDTSQYLNDRWKECTDSTFESTPYTVVHQCSSHFIHNALKFIRTKTNDSHLQKLFMSSMTLLIHTSTLVAADAVLRAMIILFSSAECTHDDEYIKSYADISSMKTHIALHSKDGEKETKDEESATSQANDTIRENSPFYQHFAKLHTATIKHLNTKVTDRTNRFYMPGVLTHVINNWLPYYPLWSGIIIQKFDVVRYSNAACENWMKQVKEFLLEGVMHQKIPRVIQKLESLIIPRIMKLTVDLRTTRQKLGKGKKRAAPKTVKKPKKKRHLEKNIDLSEEYWDRKNLTNIRIGGNFKRISKTKSSSIGREKEETTAEEMIKAREIINDDKWNDPELDAADSDNSFEEESSDSRSGEETNEEGIDENPGADVSNVQEMSSIPPWRNVDIYPPKWKRNVNLHVYGLLVNQLSLNTLRPNARVDDAIINAFLSVLSNLYPGGPLAFDIYFMSSLKRQEEHSMGYYMLAQNVEAWSYDYWLIPMNIGDVHWTLLLISFSHQCFVYFDSQHGNPDASTFPRLCYYINNVFQVAGLQPCDWSQWAIYCPKDIPHQGHGTQNSHDNCGIHISTWAYLMYSGAFFDFHEDDMNTARKWIMTTLFEHHGRLNTPVVHSKPRLERKRCLVKKLEELLSNPMDEPAIEVSSCSPKGAPSTREFVRSIVVERMEAAPALEDLQAKQLEMDYRNETDTAEKKHELTSDDQLHLDDNFLDNPLTKLEWTGQPQYRSFQQDIGERFFNSDLDYPDQLSNLQSLLPDQQVDNEVIDAFLSKIQVVASINELRLLCFPQEIATNLLRGQANDRFKEWHQKVQLENCDMWFLPLRMDDNYWAFFIIIFNLSIMVFIDPLHKPPPEIFVMNVWKYIGSFRWARARGNLKKFSDWVLFAPKNIPVSKFCNNYNTDSGLYICIWAYMIVSSSNTRFEEIDMDVVRRGISRFILEFSATSASSVAGDSVRTEKLPTFNTQVPKSKKKSSIKLETEIPLHLKSLYEFSKDIISWVKLANEQPM